MKKEQVNKIYKTLQKNRKAMKIRAILMACLLLAINSFAWFIFVSKGTGNINADVVSWDIVFFGDDEQVEEKDFDLDDLYPGMLDYSQIITVQNRSDLSAIFSFEVESITVYGKEYKTDDLVSALENEFPFAITFSYTKTDLAPGESLTFTLTASWPFEAENEYFKINYLYDYIEGIDYYTLSGDSYEKVSVTESNYASSLENGLYVESDDADTYWGEKSVLFEQYYPDFSAMQLKIKLIVTQKPE